MLSSVPRQSHYADDGYTMSRPIITLASSDESALSGSSLQSPYALASDLLSTPSKPKLRPPLHSQQHSSSSTSNSSANTPSSNLLVLLDANGLARTSSNESHRSSSEFTAVTIYSMYGDSSPRDSSMLALRPSSANFGPADRHSFRYDPSHNSKPIGVSMQNPKPQPPPISSHPLTDRPPSSQRQSPYPRNSFARSSEEGNSVYGTPSPLSAASSRAASPSQSQLSVAIPPPSTAITTAHTLPEDMSNRLQVPRRKSSVTPSASSSPGRSQSSLLPPVPGDDEDVDSLYVRSTYARLEQTGVPGDGFEEGIERTRARPSAKLREQQQHRTTVWGPDALDVTKKELEFLSTLDRYGFVSTSVSGRQENRLALLPVVPLKKLIIPTKPVRTPPTSPSVPSKEISTVPAPKEHSKEVSRSSKWDRMMKVAQRDQGGNVQAWTFDDKKGRKMRDRVYKGIPDRWRAGVWWTIIERARLNIMSAPNPSDSARRLSPADLTRQYLECLDMPSTYDIQIDLDVPRTISGHVLFHTRYGHGQRSLFHVLHSFSLLCPDCGYCQGMGPIAATLLCYMEPERVYASMVRIHDSYDMHSVFSPGFPGLLESIYVQEKILQKLLPDVYASFGKHMISSTSYATKWYITLFSNSFPFQTQLRLWDAFFLEGRDVIVITAVAIIWVLREHLASAQASFESILSLLSSFFVAEDEDVLMTWMNKALADKRLRTDMNNWRLEWRELVKSGKDRTALL